MDHNPQPITSGANSRWNQGQKIALLAGGGAARRAKLSDITNTVCSATIETDQEIVKAVPCQSSQDYVGQLAKENAALLKLLAEKNKIIEVTGAELQKYRMQSQKASQQNWQLARVNSQMLAELNLSKEKIKTLQHELSCTLAAFKVKSKDLEEKDNLNRKLIEKHGSKELGSSEPEAVADTINLNLTTGNRISKLSRMDNLKEQPIYCTSTQEVESVDKVVEMRKSVHKKTSSMKSEIFEYVGNLLKESSTQNLSEAFHNTTSQPKDHLLISENKNCKRARKDIPKQQTINSNKSTQLDALAENVDGRRKSLRRKASNLKSEKHEAKVELPNIEENQDPVDSLMSEVLHEETFAQPRDPDLSRDSTISNKGRKGLAAVDCSQQTQIAAVEDTNITRRTTKAVRKKSSNSKLELSEVEASSNIEDGTLPFHSLGFRVILEEASDEVKCSNAAMRKGEEQDTNHSNVGEGELQRRTSVGRPLRRAVQNVSSYVEPSLVRKMRREDYLPVK